MISIQEVQRRSETGPVMEESQYDRRRVKKLRALADKITVPFDDSVVIQSEELADAVYEAGIELVSEVGIYNLSTNRVVEFSRQELEEAGATRKPERVFGKGKDKVRLRVRDFEDTRPPVAVLGPGCPVSTDMFIPEMVSYIKEPEISGVIPGFVLETDGAVNKAGTPGEMLCAFAEARLTKEALAAAGKPGAYVLLSVTAVTPVATVAGFNPKGLNPRIAQINNHIYPDLKIEWGLLNMAAYAQHVGIEPWADAFVVLGAFTRNPVEWAITSLGGTLALFAYTNAHMTHTDAINTKGSFTARACLQADSLRNIALTKRVHVPEGTLCLATGGAGTRMSFLENAAMALLGTATGCAFLWGGTSGSGVVMDGASGLVGKLTAEVGIAAAGMPKKEANRILDKILAEYESPPPAGKTFAELYDVATVEPKPEHLAEYRKVKQELKNFGVPFKY